MLWKAAAASRVLRGPVSRAAVTPPAGSVTRPRDTLPSVLGHTPCRAARTAALPAPGHTTTHNLGWSDYAMVSEDLHA